MTNYIKGLEQDLDMAKNALKRIGDGEFSGKILPSMPPKDAAEFFADQTYLAIKDEKDE